MQGGRRWPNRGFELGRWLLRPDGAVDPEGTFERRNSREKVPQRPNGYKTQTPHNFYLDLPTSL
jgi:hypothetical protein